MRLLHHLMWVNLLLGGFNLIPALPMDGGRILRAFLSGSMGHLPATRLAVRIARWLAAALGLWGLLGLPPLPGSSFFVVALAVMLWIMAGAELRAATFLHFMQRMGMGQDGGLGPDEPGRGRPVDAAVEVLDREGRPVRPPGDAGAVRQQVEWPFFVPGWPGRRSGSMEMEEEQLPDGRSRWVLRDASGRIVFRSDEPS